jgi:hypothetical protein
MPASLFSAAKLSLPAMQDGSGSTAVDRSAIVERLAAGIQSAAPRVYARWFDPKASGVTTRLRSSRGETGHATAGVLLASTAWWAFPVQIALGFAERGVRVQAICSTGHALRKARVVERCFAYRGLSPLGSMTRAIKAFRPALIVPCDDRAVAHLHALHARCRDRDPDMAALIERSLGDPRHFEAVQRRSVVISIAQRLGVAAPQMAAIGGRRDLRMTIAHFGLPAVMKLDGTWGGLGVTVVKSAAEAEVTRVAMRRRHSLLVAIKRLLVDRDTFSMFEWLRRPKPTVNLQRFAPGRPATCAVACWKGEVLACSVVEVMRSQNACGASTIVRPIDSPAMVQVVRSMVRELGLSGVCGFDFLIDDVSGSMQLLECNPRATPLCHINLGPHADPLGALAERAFGRVRKTEAAASLPEFIAFFPQCWSLEPGLKLLQTCLHDVPWSEPDVVRELVQPPWPERGLLARLLNRRRPKAALPVADA